MILGPQRDEELLELVQRFGRCTELKDILLLALEVVEPLFEYDRASAVIFEVDKETAYVACEFGNPSLGEIAIRLADYPELFEARRTGEPLVVADVNDAPLMASVVSTLEGIASPPKSSLLLPLNREGTTVGVIFLRSGTILPKPSPEAVRQGALIAGLASISLGAALQRDETRRAQRAIKKSEERTARELEDLRQFSNYFEQAHDGIVVTDAKGVIRYANRTSEALLGEGKDLGGVDFVGLVSERSQNLARRAIAGDRVGDGYGYLDLLVDAPDGEGDAVISVAVRGLLNEEGILISFRNVTELREIESELRQTKDFLENLIQSSVDAIVAADMSGRIILFNRAAERILGYSAHEVVGRMAVRTIYTEGEADDVARRLRSGSSGGRGRLEPIRKDLVAKNGEFVPVNLSAATIYEGDREVATVGIFTDLRERLRIEEKLSQVQRKLQMTERQSVAIELAGAAAHELNQPLTSILGYAEMLRSRIPEDARERKPIEVICRETERMAEIVRQIGHLTAYKTQSYVGGSEILDLDRDSLDRDSEGE